MALTLTIEHLRHAITGGAGAFRCVTDLRPAGGDGDKVFPPTYEGGLYATEDRLIDGTRVPCVILDSVQSQANRLELALLDARRAGEIAFPLVQVDFGLATDPEVQAIGLLTALEAPHRLADAYFLASEAQEQGAWKPFRHRDPTRASTLGQRFETASLANATPLFEMCPSVLLFGMWDSHGIRGGMGQKLQRALVSEIVGIDVQTGVQPASRIDPVIPTTADIPVQETADGWRVLDRGTKAKKLSEVGLGNVTPSLSNHKTGVPHHGGVSLRLARQITGTVAASPPAFAVSNRTGWRTPRGRAHQPGRANGAGGARAHRRGVAVANRIRPAFPMRADSPARDADRGRRTCTHRAVRP